MISAQCEIQDFEVTPHQIIQSTLVLSWTCDALTDKLTYMITYQLISHDQCDTGNDSNQHLFTRILTTQGGKSWYTYNLGSLFPYSTYTVTIQLYSDSDSDDGNLDNIQSVDATTGESGECDSFHP